MSKINYDGHIITETLIPAIEKSLKQLKIASVQASNINYPNGEVNWPQIKSKINDCLIKTEKYLSWLKEIDTKYSQNLENLQESMKEITIEDIKTRKSIVK